MLQVRENEISLHKSSGGTAYLRTLEQTFSGMYIVVVKVKTYRQSKPWFI